MVSGKAAVLAVSSKNLTKLAREQQVISVTLPAHRGAILDRYGQELAVGKSAQTVFAAPCKLNNPAESAEKLADALHIRDPKERKSMAKRLSDRESWFAYVARKADPELAKAALALKIDGVGSYEEEKRLYPMKGSLAQVLGFAGVENTGLAGLELTFDKELCGKAGKEEVVRDPAGHALKIVRQTPAVPGSDVQLTIDESIQLAAEDVLSTTVRTSHAKAAAAIVMDPKTGEVLAMANVPKVKNHDFSLSEAANRNRCVTDIYEPGSIFKLVTISGALQDGVVTPTTTYTLAPTLTIYDRTITESHKRGVVNYSVREILQWSSNVGSVKIGMKMGKKSMLHWMDEFGFAKRTGIEFPGEAAGIVPPAEQWSGTSIANIPMGQGIAVTPLQMAVAFSIVANDGVHVEPRLIARVGKEARSSKPGRRVISAKVASQIRSMLATAVDKGTGEKAKIPGYAVAGKTGTAEKPLPNGKGYSKTNYVASFVGMVPAARPRLVVMVMVDEPRSSIYGGDIAAPAVKKIMQYSLQRMKIAP